MYGEWVAYVTGATLHYSEEIIRKDLISRQFNSLRSNLQESIILRKLQKRFEAAELDAWNRNYLSFSKIVIFGRPSKSNSTIDDI